MLTAVIYLTWRLVAGRQASDRRRLAPLPALRVVPLGRPVPPSGTRPRLRAVTGRQPPTENNNSGKSERSGK